MPNSTSRPQIEMPDRKSRNATTNNAARDLLRTLNETAPYVVHQDSLRSVLSLARKYEADPQDVIDVVLDQAHWLDEARFRRELGVHLMLRKAAATNNEDEAPSLWEHLEEE